jgi:hypothetical protein
MNMREGDRVMSAFTGKVYEVRTIKDQSAVLESLDGSSHVWTERATLKLFYKKVENGEKS